MQYLIFAKFLSGGSLAPEEFLVGINAQWSWLEGGVIENWEKLIFEGTTHPKSPKSVICIADYKSVKQLDNDLSKMPGAGIANIEVLLLSEEMDFNKLSLNPA